MAAWNDREPSLRNPCRGRRAGAWLLFLLHFAGCNTPIRKALALDYPPRLGILGFKVTAPIHDLSAIAESPKDLDPEAEARLLDERLRSIEERAAAELASELRENGTVEPVPIPEGLFDTKRGSAPSLEQIAQLQKDLHVDAILYGEIPWYGKTTLLYPILGESLDITAESVVLGVATHWYLPLVLGNIGFELLTSTPLWFGGWYVFGWAFRPVTVEAWVLAADDGRTIWHDSNERILGGKILKTYPESEQSKKETQLEASLREAISEMAKSLSE